MFGSLLLLCMLSIMPSISKNAKIKLLERIRPLSRPKTTLNRGHNRLLRPPRRRHNVLQGKHQYIRSSSTARDRTRRVPKYFLTSLLRRRRPTKPMAPSCPTDNRHYIQSARSPLNMCSSRGHHRPRTHIPVADIPGSNQQRPSHDLLEMGKATQYC